MQRAPAHDHRGPALLPHPGRVDLRDARYPDDGVLHLNASDWAEFLAAAKRGDVDALTGPGETA